MLDAVGIEKGDRVVVWGANSLSMVVAYLAIRLGVPVVPIRKRGTFDLLPSGSLIPKRGKVSVRIGKSCRIREGSPKETADYLKGKVENL